MKRCKKCGETKPFDAYYKAAGTKDGHRGECKACSSTMRKQWYRANRERAIERVVAWQRSNRERYNARMRVYRAEHAQVARAQHLERAFGLTIEQYDALLARQDGRCAVCRRSPGKTSLHVDHDHDSGKIRGLLCFRCNGGLGQFGERLQRLEHAIEYLAATGVSARERELARGARARAMELRSLRPA